MASQAICAIEGCGKDRTKGSRGWCEMHYARWRRHGDPLCVKSSRPKTFRRNHRVEWLREHTGFSGDECLPWAFSCNEHGYGIVRWKARQTRASRVMCELVNGPPLENNLEAAHSCGNGHLGCCNPRHLSWKTSAENSADSKVHGTWNHGEKVPQSKLKEEQVREIRRLGGTMFQREIAARFGVSRRAVGLILTGKNWAWLK